MAAALAIALSSMTPLHAQEPSAPADNAELAAMFEADQAARQEAAVDAETLASGDAERRARASAMLESGAIATAADYYHAAILFQHGGQPDAYLLAHVLATRALALGMAEAEWIAAASLDRFLHSIGRAQVFGTQYDWSEESGLTMEPYDRELVDDRLRSAAGVETLGQQELKLENMRHAVEPETHSH